MNVASTNPIIKKKPGAGNGFGLEKRNLKVGTHATPLLS
jgi:hypothetical protein